MRPSLLRSLALVLRAALLVPFAVYAFAADSAADQKLKVDDNSFRCIMEMTKVRHFYVDNLLGNVAGTVAVATADQGEYPPGSVLQLMPNEAMVKHEKGFIAETHDWEFFYVDTDQNGSKIFTRGFSEVNNRLGLNCFDCHKMARPEFDLVCEQDHGCAPIPVTRAMFGALQRTDPRCKNAGPVSAEDKAALDELSQIVAALKGSTSSDNK